MTSVMIAPVAFAQQPKVPWLPGREPYIYQWRTYEEIQVALSTTRNVMQLSIQ